MQGRRRSGMEKWLFEYFSKYNGEAESVRFGISTAKQKPKVSNVIAALRERRQRWHCVGRRVCAYERGSWRTQTQFKEKKSREPYPNPTQRNKLNCSYARFEHFTGNKYAERFSGGSAMSALSYKQTLRICPLSPLSGCLWYDHVSVTYIVCLSSPSCRIVRQ